MFFRNAQFGALVHGGWEKYNESEVFANALEYKQFQVLQGTFCHQGTDDAIGRTLKDAGAGFSFYSFLCLTKTALLLRCMNSLNNASNQDHVGALQHIDERKKKQPARWLYR